mmetsp:Transcript_7747/g.15813  ORF Transcript_7747/g.15813 Transcript_7747/m.15813 type:complete len:221 (+) Transcript_7747:1087-1749(+)
MNAIDCLVPLSISLPIICSALPCLRLVICLDHCLIDLHQHVHIPVFAESTCMTVTAGLQRALCRLPPDMQYGDHIGVLTARRASLKCLRSVKLSVALLPNGDCCHRRLRLHLEDRISTAGKFGAPRHANAHERCQKGALSLDNASQSLHPLVRRALAGGGRRVVRRRTRRGVTCEPRRPSALGEARLTVVGAACSRCRCMGARCAQVPLWLDDHAFSQEK